MIQESKLALNPKRAVALWIGFLLAEFALNLFVDEIQHIFDYKQLIDICNVFIRLTFTFYLIWYIQKQHIDLGDTLRLRTVKRSVIFSVFLFCISFSFMAIFLKNIINLYFGTHSRLILVEYPGFSDIIKIIGITIIFPIWEELSCRGLLSSSLESRYGKWVGIIITSGAFALMHYYPLNIYFTFFIGIGLGWIASETKSLLPALLIHMIFNMSIFSSKLSQFGDELFITHNILIWESFIIVFAVALLVVSIFQLLTNHSKAVEP